MKQLIQYLRSGETLLEDIPVPALQPGHVPIRTQRSLISIGTERSLVEFGRASLLSKVRNNPERVAQALEKIKADGLIPTLEAVFRKLDEPLPLGYCNAGVIEAVGTDIDDLHVGDRVVSNGMHAEFVCAPRNMVAKIPDNVSLDEAVFTIIGSVGLHALRLAQQEFGSTVIIIGLGLVGCIMAQIAKANGCRVITCDIDPERVELGKKLGFTSFQSSVDDVYDIIFDLTDGHGADAVIIAASAPKSDLINMAAKWCRKKGAVILTGVAEMQIDRSIFYQKEIAFHVSGSYGPGRYDDSYEQEGRDYPYPYVRWTLNRNFQAVLQSMADKQLQTAPLISERIALADAPAFYNHLSSTRNIATLITYAEEAENTNWIQKKVFALPGKKPVLAIIGSGNYARATLLPALKKCGAVIKYIAAQHGEQANMLAKKYDIPIVTTDTDRIFTDKDVDLVIIATRHDTHAALACTALQHHKNVFVEKPLALNIEEIERITEIYNSTKAFVFTGFNRRHAPASHKVKHTLDGTSGLNIIITVNAGHLPESHWLRDPKQGGGRIIGEACHFVDLAAYFADSRIHSVYASALPTKDVNAHIQLKFMNGSRASIQYISNGTRKYPKEKITLFNNGKVIVIDNFRSVTTYGLKIPKIKKRQDKGHFAQFEHVLHLLSSGAAIEDTFVRDVHTMMVTFAIEQSIRENAVITM